MAGVSAIQYARQPGQKSNLEPSKVSTNFLAASHFTISQDDSVTKGSLKSIFKKDYVPWDINAKPDAAKPPKPANVLQTDDRYFNEKSSETRQQYEPHEITKPEMRNITNKLGATNFKMDADRRLNTFQTTHNSDYQPKQSSSYERGAPKQDPLQSFIPQGDPEKAPEPLSDYKDRYHGHDIDTKPELAGSAHQGNKLIIVVYSSV